jgi:hypothetical protein
MAHALIQGYQIGYRTKGIGGYTEPYTDLPMIRVSDFAVLGQVYSASSAHREALELLKKMQWDFPNAEWRMVECWD